MLRILIVDDEQLSRRIINKACEEIEFVEHIDLCNSALDAFKMLSEVKYDFVLIDHILPKVKGLLSIGVIKSISPETKIILLSQSEDKNLPINAITNGATAFIKKPNYNSVVQNIKSLKTELLKYFSLALNVEEVNNDSQNLPKPSNFKDTDLFLFASSTGGPRTLDLVFESFPNVLSKPVILVQHMPEGFTKYFVQSIKRKFVFEVGEVVNNEILKNTKVYVSPGGMHTVFKRLSKKVLKLSYQDSEPVNGVKPAADVTFMSAVKHLYDKKIVVIIFTGIGKDGLKGVEELKKNNNVTVITESKKSCVAYGMSRVVEEAKLSDYSLTKEEIATFLGGVL